MIMTRTLAAGVVSGLALALSMSAAHADSSLSGVENSRAHERAGHRLTRQDRENLDRYGSNDDGYWSGGGYGYSDRYDGGPGVSVYIGPRRGYGPFGY